MKDPTNSPRVREKEFGVSRASLMASMVKNPPQCRRLGFDLWVRKIPWRRERLPTPAFSFREFHRQRSLVGYSSWGLKESDVTEQVILWFFFRCQWHHLWWVGSVSISNHSRKWRVLRGFWDVDWFQVTIWKNSWRTKSGKKKKKNPQQNNNKNSNYNIPSILKRTIWMALCKLWSWTTPLIIPVKVKQTCNLQNNKRLWKP